MDRLTAMTALVTVAELHSFAAAARRLRLSPPAVTRLISALEDQLATRLLQRTTRTVRLTDAGARYLDRTRRIGAGDIYFDVHVEADEHHSIMGLEHLTAIEPGSHRARPLLAKALEGVALWAAMIHSWIGVGMSPVVG